jgi:hypothetical protein
MKKAKGKSKKVKVKTKQAWLLFFPFAFYLLPFAFLRVSVATF